MPKRKNKIYHYKYRCCKEKGIYEIQLQDKTIFMVNANLHKISILFPKNKKFLNMFKTQIKDKKRKYIGFDFNGTEIQALFSGLNKMLE